MSKIFVSYKRKDSQKVYSIIEEIRSRLGVECWCDIGGIETQAQFASKICKAIDDSEIVLFMHSIHHLNIDFENDWTIKELNYASAKKKKIILVKLDDAQLDNIFLLEYGSKNYIEYTDKIQFDKLISDLGKWLNISITKDDDINGGNHSSNNNSPFNHRVILIVLLIILSGSIFFIIYKKNLHDGITSPDIPDINTDGVELTEVSTQHTILIKDFTTAFADLNRDADTDELKEKIKILEISLIRIKEFESTHSNLSNPKFTIFQKQVSDLCDDLISYFYNKATTLNVSLKESQDWIEKREFVKNLKDRIQ